MEIVAPLPLSLESAGASPIFIAPVWTVGAVYAANEVARFQTGEVWEDWRANSAHTATSNNGPGTSTYTRTKSWYQWQWHYGVIATDNWTRLGPSAVTGGFTYSTNVRLSLHPEWSIQSLAEGAVRHDSVTRSDYRALIAMTAAENNIRPSQAIQSSNEIVRSRWLLLGAGNAWAAFDYQLNSYLAGRASSGALVNPTFTAVVETQTAVDRITFAGLVNVREVSVDVMAGGIFVERVASWQIPYGTAYGVTLPTASMPIRRVEKGIGLMLVVTLIREDWTAPAMLGVMCVGEANTVGATEWGVETSIIPFSRKERDPTFGTVEFLKRGSARSIKASCIVDPQIITGDVVQQILSRYEGAPVFWDFNNAPGSGCGTTSVENRIRHSENFAAGWSPLGVTLSASPRSIPGFDGLRATTMLETTANANHRLNQNWYFTKTPPDEYVTISIYARSESGRHLLITHGNNRRWCFDLLNGRLAWISGTNLTVPAASGAVDALGGDWYRCSATFMQRSTTMELRPFFCIVANTDVVTSIPNYVGDPEKGLTVFGAMVNRGRVAAPYIQTGAEPIRSDARADYERLKAFGFFSNMGMAISAFSFESLSLEVEGLVE